MRDSDSAGHDRRQARTERGSRDQKLLLRQDAELLRFLLQWTAEQNKASLAAAVVDLTRLVPVAPAAAGMATATATATESRTRVAAAVAIAIAMEAVAAMVTETAEAAAAANAANAIATRPR